MLKLKLKLSGKQAKNFIMNYFKEFGHDDYFMRAYVDGCVRLTGASVLCITLDNICTDDTTRLFRLLSYILETPENGI